MYIITKSPESSFVISHHLEVVGHLLLHQNKSQPCPSTPHHCPVEKDKGLFSALLPSFSLSLSLILSPSLPTSLSLLPLLLSPFLSSPLN